MSATMLVEPTKHPIVYPTSDEAIEAIRLECLSLAVADENDKAGAKACDDARKKVKALRCEIEKRRKELKADALEYGRLVDAEAGRLTAMLTPIERRLEEQAAIVADAEKRCKEAEAKALDERFERRLKELQSVETKAIPYASLRGMSDDAYAKLLADATEAHETATAARKAEAERLARLEAERKEEKRKADEQAAENRRLQAEVDRLKQEQLDRERAEREKAEQARKDAEAAKANAERKAKEEREEAERKAKLEREESGRRLREAEAKAAKEKADAERKAKEEREAREAETLRQEAEAAARIADTRAFEAIKAEFPTLDLAWVEIHRLRKLAMLRAYDS